MEPSARREQIMSILKKATAPVSATALAKSFQVSRQLIVGDIALIRATGVNITATPKGYVLHGDVLAEDR
ncbi:HTH domain-containing protein, partial [Carnobacterium sp.]|uniref:HTH domain-containing protein n=1 Tax=Carnobacterium sp. TaxID=48221 RepID=UPI0028AD5CA1